MAARASVKGQTVIDMTNQTPLTIWLVDDEPIILSVLSNLLKRCGEEWDIQCYPNPIQALGAIRSQRPDIVVADYDMPKMSGVEFLEQIRIVAPGAIRFLISGYGLSEITTSPAHGYFTKPIPFRDFCIKIQNAASTLRQSVDYQPLHNTLAPIS